jgi:hypothetical protein
LIKKCADRSIVEAKRKVLNELRAEKLVKSAGNETTLPLHQPEVRNAVNASAHRVYAPFLPALAHLVNIVRKLQDVGLVPVGLCHDAGKRIVDNAVVGIDKKRISASGKFDAAIARSSGTLVRL